MMRRTRPSGGDSATSVAAPGTRSNGGMSVLELAVGLAIVGVLIAASLPRLVGYLNLRQLSLTDTRLIADVRAAADRARTKHVLVRVRFTGGSGSVTVDAWSAAPGGDACDASQVPLGQGTWTRVEAIALPAGLTVTTVPAINPFVFSCLGTPDDPSTGASILPLNNPLTVTIGNAAGTRTIAVDMGGRVQ